MTLIQVTVTDGVYTAAQKQEIVERLTDAMASIQGESMRKHTWCLVLEVASGEGGVGGALPHSRRRHSARTELARRVRHSNES